MSNKKIYLETPTLAETIKKFDIHYEVAKDTPILIAGQSGVGKSNFLDIYKMKEIANERPEPVFIDCSMFIGSDPNIAKSTLFGHKKGSFTGATNDRPGLIKQAIDKKSAIILDEIGELPPEVQSMLLVFIDTGIFYPLGSNIGEKEESKVRIIAATNRETQLRGELRYRFFKFPIQPFYERRKDVLMFFSWFSPELFKDLTIADLLTLWSYNWPGGIREIQQTVMSLTCIKKYLNSKGQNFKHWTDWKNSGIVLIDDYKSTDINPFYTSLSIGNLRLNKIKFEKLTENLAHKYNKYLSKKTLPDNNKFDFFEFTPFKCEKFKLPENIWITSNNYPHLNQDYKTIFTSIDKICKYFYDIFGINYSHDNDLSSFDLSYQEDNEADHPPLHHYSHYELEHIYYSQLLQTHKSKTDAAKSAGINISTFHDRLKKHDLK